MKTLQWRNYCPKMPELRTKEDIFRNQINKEAELIVADHRMPPINNRKLIKWIRSQRTKKFEAGIYNFITYQVKGLLP